MAQAETDVREFVSSALARTASGDRLARSMHGAAQTYAQGVNDGIKEALTHVLAFIDREAVAGPGHVEDVPVSASEPNRPKAGR